MTFSCSIARCFDAPDSRFVLAGIVNRMDRAYLAEANCGEIRLIYRLTRTIGRSGRWHESRGCR